jgi:osmotically-inducible protein OsmY
MDERDRRNPRSDRDDRDERGQRQGSDPQRQPQQWHDESYRSSGSGSAFGAGQGDDDYPRERNQDQMGGSSGAYSGDRYRTGQPEDDRSRQRSEGEGEYEYRSGPRPGGQEQRRSYAGYGADRYTPSRYTRGGGRSFGSFTSEDYGGRDFESEARGYGPSSGYGERQDYGYGGTHETGGRRFRQSEDYGSWREYGERRGFLERAGDTIASWFGNEEASRRREQDQRQDYRGRGPSDYTRSDERIREDANDHLTHDPSVDATHITIKVENGEVTLDGTVDSRQAKRRAEDVVDSISGVRHVQNNLRVSDNRGGGSGGFGSGSSGGATSGGSGGLGGGANAMGASATSSGIGGAAGTQGTGLGGSSATNKPSAS